MSLKAWTSVIYPPLRTPDRFLFSIGVFVQFLSLIGFNNQYCDETLANKTEIKSGKHDGPIIYQKNAISLVGKNSFIVASRLHQRVTQSRLQPSNNPKNAQILSFKILNRLK